jgi:hypothetical protein
VGQVDHRPDVRLAAGLGTLVVTAVAGPAVWAWSVHDRLPAEVARHWGSGGQVTGTWSLTTQLLFLGATTLLVSGGLGAVAVLSRYPVMIRRVLAGCAVWTATLFGVSQVDALRGQVGLTDPVAAPAPGVGIAVGAVAGLLLAVAVASLAREHGHQRLPAHPRVRARPDLAAVDRSFETTSTSRGLRIVLLLAAVGFAIPVAFGAWWVAVLGLTVLVPLAVMSRFRTRIDGAGLSVRAGGLTLLRVPIDDVADARVIDHLDAFWEFGGWGLRVGTNGRVGVVAGSGPALAITRVDGPEVVVSLDDPEEARATLAELAVRSTHGRGSADEG